MTAEDWEKLRKDKRAAEVKRLKALRAEAMRFVASLDALIASDWEHRCDFPARESGSCKRASMDLTRALADYRAGRSIGGVSRW